MPPFGRMPASRNAGLRMKIVTGVPSVRFSVVVPLRRSHRAMCSSSKTMRVAHTPHYDGVKKDGKEPAVIGIFGQAPIEFKLTDPTKPPIREA